jgi:hypothetical protein
MLVRSLVLLAWISPAAAGEDCGGGGRPPCAGQIAGGIGALAFPGRDGMLPAPPPPPPPPAVTLLPPPPAAPPPPPAAVVQPGFFYPPNFLSTR